MHDDDLEIIDDGLPDTEENLERLLGVLPGYWKREYFRTPGWGRTMPWDEPTTGFVVGYQGMRMDGGPSGAFIARTDVGEWNRPAFNRLVIVARDEFGKLRPLTRAEAHGFRIDFEVDAEGSPDPVLHLATGTRLGTE